MALFARRCPDCHTRFPVPATPKEPCSSPAGVRRAGAIRLWAAAVLGLAVFALGALALAGWFAGGEVNPWAWLRPSQGRPPGRRGAPPASVVLREEGPTCRLALFAAPPAGGG